MTVAEKQKSMSIVEKFNAVQSYVRVSTIPVQTVPLAEKLGIVVYRVDFSNDTISGKIQKTKNSESGYEILVNTKHSLNRRRFTIAHEIAHYVFHEEKIGDGLIDDGLYRSGLRNSDETQANAFAADILMPRDKLIEEIGNIGPDIQRLSEKFQVSETAMTIRLGLA